MVLEATARPALTRMSGFAETVCNVSEWEELNLRPPHPKCGMIPLPYTPVTTGGAQQRYLSGNIAKVAVETLRTRTCYSV